MSMNLQEDHQTETCLKSHAQFQIEWCTFHMVTVKLLLWMYCPLPHNARHHVTMLLVHLS